MEAEKHALLTLHLIPKIGNVIIKNLVSYAGSAQAVLQWPKSKLLKIPGIGNHTVNNILSREISEKANQEFEKARKANVKIVSYLEKDYPYRLKQIPDAPPLIYTKGKFPPEEKKPTIAVIGTRNATEYGKKLTEDIIAGLSPLDPVILSGLAYGIDIHAHRNALKNNLTTFAVMGSGIDVVYPAAHRTTSEEMMGKGGLITEQAFGSKPDAFNFPARNRIIAGMADLVVVVEAAKKGGALITAELANSYDREVAAFPGRVNDTYSEGCNKLIKKNKAHLVETAEDVLYLMNWELENQAAIKQKVIDLSSFNEEEQNVINTLLQNNRVLPLDILSIKSQVNLNRLASVLLTLEFQGIIKSLPGKRYQMV
ncbi:DNA-protecting protein DprA [Marivirga sp. S37H4]|uniref:DNA-protecting protein DprA n=1 Tax=Marivirga aurantiaca TaxID=2802615 RepID=A0A934WV86_9BACT|nr:DNA-processing protein DprA [Marivirga aurantiaca]MBK6263565.1 DNA-protecting protein DprA [Marivirga aurantiaca]